MRTGAAHLGRRYRTARGISFLEVVFATVILGLTVATMAATVGAIGAQQGRSQHLLACAELCNRLIIQYLDDEHAMPPRDLTIPYGDSEYRWKLSVTRVESQLDQTVVRALEDATVQQGGQTPDRLKKLAVTVWLSEKSGGSLIRDAGAPQQTLVRVVDPIAFSRRPPDSIQRLMEEGTDRLMERLTGSDIEPEESGP